MRRARCNKCQRTDGSRIPFGGVNIIFCGDWWQLPPVRAPAIFSNPFLDKYEASEQRVLQMFWKKDQDSLTELFELTEAHRFKKDPWWGAVVNELRHGQESWESYCFINGLPTKNVGTWMQKGKKPSCGS